MSRYNVSRRLDTIQTIFNLHYRARQFTFRERFVMFTELNDLLSQRRWTIARYALFHDFKLWLLVYCLTPLVYFCALGCFLQYLYTFYLEDVLVTPQVSRTGVKLSDLKGIDEFKQELEDVVHFLKNRKAFTSAGVQLPRGILLVGPPGCGKTQIARALADEAGVSFFQVSASTFVSPIPGQGPRAIRNLFRAARFRTPCIVFIDEIDSLGTRRTYSNAPNDVVNTLLAEMDGFASNTSVLVVAATNREQALDEALKRAGRFDLTINISLPQAKGREEIFAHYASKVRHGALSLAQMAHLTAGFSGADIQNVVNLAAIAAAKQGRSAVTQADLQQSYEKVRLGVRSAAPISDEERLKGAYREAGKAVLSVKDTLMPEVRKIVLSQFETRVIGKSIVGGTGDRVSYTKKEMLARIDYFLAAKAVEGLVYPPGEHSVYALADFGQARNMVRNYLEFSGMEADFNMLVVSGGRLTQDYVDRLDQRADALVKERLAKVTQLLKANMASVEAVARKLAEKKELTREQVVKLVRKTAG